MRVPVPKTPADRRRVERRRGRGERRRSSAQGQIRGDSTAWGAVVRKTQRGPGATSVRPGEAARRGSGQPAKNPSQTGACRSCGQALSNRDAGMRNGRDAGRTPTRVSEGPKRTRRSNRCECVLRGDHRESEAQSFRSDPWAAVRRARLNPMQPVPDSGDGNPPGF